MENLLASETETGDLTKTRVYNLSERLLEDCMRDKLVVSVKWLVSVAVVALLAGSVGGAVGWLRSGGSLRGGDKFEVLVNLLIILLALLALGGIAAYLDIRSRLVRELGPKLHEDVQQRLAQVQRYEVQTSLRLWMRFSDLYYTQYDFLLERADGEFDGASFQFLLNEAIDTSQRALDVATQAGFGESNASEVEQDLMARCEGNLAYHLATRRDAKDKKRAHTLGWHAYRSGLKTDNHHRLETYGWVLVRFAGDNQQELQRGTKVIQDLLKREDLDIEWRRKIRGKYRDPRLFPDGGLDFP